MIHGWGGPPPGGARIEAHHDHRIAMSFLVLGGLARAPVTVAGAETIETSFPGFAALMNRLGAHRAGRAMSGPAPGRRGGRARGLRQDHPRAPPGGALRPGLPGYRPALPRGRPALLQAGKPFTDTASAAAAAAAVTAADLIGARCAARPSARARRSWRRSRRCVGRSPSSAVRRRRPRRGAGGPGHRHGGAARRQPQDLRHRQCRGTRRRRCKELQALGVPTIYDDVLAQLQERDARDRSRAIAPLVPASDAFVIDTTDRDIETAFEVARAYVAGPARGGTPAAS